MYLISFDVGIKNMAYCIFDLSGNSIVDWDIIDCSSSADPVEKKSCGELLKNGNICSNVAKYNHDTLCVCEKHAKMSKRYHMPKKRSFSKLTTEELKNMKNTYLPNHPSTAKKDITTALKQYFETHTWNPLQHKTNASKIDLVHIGRILHDKLSRNQHLRNVSQVIIENQISPIANRMKTIQGMLAQHFISLQVPLIEFVSSSNKLKDLQTQSDAKSTYKQHKQDSVFYCQQYIEKNYDLKWKDHLLKSLKKDDLADCFLQGIWYLHKKI